MTNQEAFKKNFFSSKLRQEFASATGLDATKEPSAFIAYLNNMMLMDLINSVHRLDHSSQSDTRVLQRICRHLNVAD